MQHEPWHVTSLPAARAILVVLLAALLAACGGGGSEGGDSPPAPAATSTTASIDTAGGTVTLPSGARVAIPAGALGGTTTIGVESGASGAPALPAGVTALGPIVAFTPHGTTFAIPVTITVPFDGTTLPAGSAPVLYKTTATGVWEQVAGASVSGNAMVGVVSSFSWAVVAPPPATMVALAGETWHYEMVYTSPTNHKKDVLVVQPEQTHDAAPLFDWYPPGQTETNPDALQVAIGPRYKPPQPLPVWQGYVSASQDATTFYTGALAPAGDIMLPNQPIGLNTSLTVTRVLRKVAETGSTRTRITKAQLSMIDGNPFSPLLSCPGGMMDCMTADLQFVVDAWAVLPNGGILTLRHADAWLWMHGLQGFWDFDAGMDEHSGDYIWGNVDFTMTDGTYKLGQSADTNLNQTLDIIIPLDTVPVGTEFTVQVTLQTHTYNRLQYESYVEATFQDPASSRGLEFIDDGVELVREPVPRPLPTPPPPPPRVPVAPCSSGADAAAGVVQMGKASYEVSERTGSKGRVTVNRSGGGRGAVSMLLSTADGTARAGTDYTSVSSVVRFEDGEQGNRIVSVPILDNDTADGDRTVRLTLSSPGGCATVGAQTTATLTIHDDDTLPAPVAFNVSGTVTGLTGSGLVLRETFGGTTTRPTADGTYVMASQVVNGTGYAIVVDTQPSNPAQACTVANGSGTIAGADVTNVAVTCTAVVPNGSLDTSFAGTGKVSNSFPSAKAIALQADGKILAVGGLVLSRYNTNGSLDTTFGGGSGKVTIVANGGGLDAMQAVAVQPDGRIVVTGMTSLPTVSNDDFVILRFNNDGTPDTTFNGSGKVVIDFAGLADRAYAVLVQPDGSIVAAGFATLGTLATANQDVAVVRVLANGTLDAGFGTGGKATVNMAGRGDFGYAAALQADGKIIVAGRAAPDGGSNPDFGLVRLQANGTVDTGFGTNGVARVDFGGSVWDEAGDVAVQADGSIVAGGYTQAAGVYRYALARLTAGGVLDTTFGTGGLLSTPFSGSGDFGRALALQADGHIVVAGQVGSTTANPDVGIARYLANGTLDSTFGSNGLVQVDFFGAIDNANDVLVQPDGRIVAAGSARNGATTGQGLVRVVP